MKLSLTRRRSAAALAGLAGADMLPSHPAAAQQSSQASLLIDGAERLDGWSATGTPRPTLGLSRDHTEGQRSLQITLPGAALPSNGESAPVFIAHSYAALSTLAQNWDWLEFDYKIVSGAASWFGLKLGGLPGVDQAVWQVPLDSPLPSQEPTWQRAALPLADPEYKWPGAMGQRFELRLIPEPSPTPSGGAADFRILVDNLRFTKGPATPVTPVVRTAADWRPGTRPRPFVFATPDELAAVRDHAAHLEWAGAEWQRIQRRADSWLAQPIDVPSQVGGWYHDYVCPEHGVRLVYQASQPTSHRCPVDDKRWTGDKLDAAWRYFRHGELGNAAKDLAIAYALASDDRYALRARDLLLNYARAYQAYRVGAAKRAFQQTLDEAVWLIALAHAYDLVYAAPSFAPEQHASVELDLLRPAALAIKANDRRESNWQTWHNAAIATAAAVLEDDTLFAHALSGPSGLEFQLAHSVLEDGFWYEGSIGYHFYALTALLRHLETLRQWGTDLYGDPRVKSLFDAPLAYAHPDLTLPANNDGAYDTTLTGETNAYEVAYARLGDPSYAWLLRRAYAAKQRAGEWALFYGAESLEGGAFEGSESPPPPLPSVLTTNRIFTASGLASLRSPTGDVHAVLDFGPHGGGHGHPDKLHLDLFAAARPLLADFGTPLYGHPLYPEWYKQTASHNTVVVDGRSQREATGELLSFIEGDSGEVEVVARAGEAYPGVTCTRRLRLTGGRLHDEVTLQSATSHTYDFILHPLGTPPPLEALSDLAPATGRLSGSTPAATADGYQHIALTARGILRTPWQATWQQPGAALRVTLMEPLGAEIILGEAPGPATDPSRRTSVLILRASAAEARFVAVYEPLAG